MEDLNQISTHLTRTDLQCYRTNSKKAIMCRLLGYIGRPIQLDRLLLKPEHSLVVQSYQPREMTSGVVNADGFGIGWYHPKQQIDPFTYKNLLPIWNDSNLPHLSRYIESGCILGCVRSATPGQPVDLSNCPPFGDRRIMGVHNGFIENFRETLYRPIRNQLGDDIYQQIGGTTDSEHIFALYLASLDITADYHKQEHPPLASALHSTLTTLTEMAKSENVRFSANLILTNGHQLVASRFANRSVAPSLYWLRDDPNFPESVTIASEPLFDGDWKQFPEQSIITVGENGDLNIHQI